MNATPSPAAVEGPELALQLRRPRRDWNGCGEFRRAYLGTAEQLIAAGLAKPGMFPGLDHPNANGATFNRKSATATIVTRRKEGFEVILWHRSKHDAAFRNLLAAAQQPLADENDATAPAWSIGTLTADRWAAMPPDHRDLVAECVDKLVAHLGKR
jgi:hypothetical protein